MDRRQFLLASGAALAATRSELAVAARPRSLALATADTESRIAIVDPFTARVLGSITTVAGPRSIEQVAASTAIVAHTAHGAVTIVHDLAVQRVLHGFGQPRNTAGRPDGSHAYVTDEARHEVVTLELPGGRIVHRTPVDGQARHLTLSPDGRTLWVALGTKARAIAILDTTAPARPRIAGRILPPFLVHDVGFAPDGRTVWVSSGDRGALLLYDVRTLRVLQRLDADAPPQHVTFLAGRAHVTSGDSGTLRLHALSDGRLLRTTAVPAGSYNVQQGDGIVLTPSLDRGTLSIVDRAGRLLGKTKVARSSHDACTVMV